MKRVGSAQDVKFTGNLYLTPQYWSKIGISDDPKLGLGVGGMLDVGLVLDDIVFSVGPHFAYNSWTADYSKKAQSSTKSVNISMQDAGVELSLVSDDLGVSLGAGTSKMGAYLIASNDQRLDYPDNNKQYTYTSMGITFDSSPFVFGIGYTAYAGEAKDANRMEFRLGVGM